MRRKIKKDADQAYCPGLHPWPLAANAKKETAAIAEASFYYNVLFIKCNIILRPFQAVVSLKTPKSLI